MKATFSLSILILFLLTSCSKKKSADSIYDFKEYISYHSQSPQPTHESVFIQLNQPITQYNKGDELPQEYLKITPNVKGKLILASSREIEFIPEDAFKPDTEYHLELQLGKLFEDIKSDLKTYTFDLKTVQPNFKISIDALQSYSKEYQYLEGVLESSDYIETKYLQDLVKASQADAPLAVKWQNPEKQTNYYPFVIDSIKRKQEDTEIVIKWDGKTIKASQKGTSKIEIPGQNSFKVFDIQTENPSKPSLTINFTNPLDPNQDFSGLVRIDKANQLKFEVENNILHVYLNHQINGEVNLQIAPGIKSNDGLVLQQPFEQKVSFEQQKPAVKLISKGVILPNAASTPLYFKTVNLKAVDIRIIEIFENNVLEFLQSESFTSTNSYNIRRVGKRIAKKTINLNLSASDKDLWKAHAVQLSDIFKAHPGAVYQVEISFKQNYADYDCDNAEASEIKEDFNLKIAENDDEEERERQYWNNEIYNWRSYIYDWEHEDDPCYPVYYQPSHFVSTNLLGSDLGLIVKKGTNGSFHFFTTNLLSTEPESGTEIQLYTYQKQLIKKIQTNSSGEAIYEGKENVAYAVAVKNKNYAYADLEDGQALSMSKFNVEGAELQNGLKGFIYTERGVHRPGDDIHLTFVLNDQENPLPEEVPVKLEVENARGKLVQREVISAGQNNSDSKALDRFYYFKIPTEMDDATGNWHAAISVGGVTFRKTLPVATVKPNRLKLKLDFDQEILTAQNPISGELSSHWLHGAPARSLKSEMDATITQDNSGFENYPKYEFNDPVRKFSETEINILKTTLSNEGATHFSKKIDLDKKAPGMLKATFLTKVFEGGGDFSMDVFTKKLAPYNYFVGLQSPDPHRFGSFYTDENNQFDVISVNSQGKPAPNRKLKVQVFKIEWRWWWNQGEDRLSRYEDASVHKPYKSFEIQTNAAAQANFIVNIPDEERGRYLIRVIDEASGHATGRTVYFYKNWFESPVEGADNAEMLVFSADKEKYKVNETAHITFPSSYEGRALLSIENGTKVLSTLWVKTEKGETKVELPITSEMAPNIYVNISLLQPHEQVKNDLPIRLYGVIPIKVEDPNTILEPQINMPTELKPEEKFTVKVSEKNKKVMTYTLAVVDEGLLDLTRFATPNIHQAFYTHQALGVKTFDIYDYVIGAYSGSVSNIYEIGGDDAAAKGKKNKANRFKPVAQFVGPFHLKSGETKSHQLEMPNYIGSVRTMVIAGNAKEGSYGNAAQTTPVKKPLMVLASLPRKLSPGEKVTLPVTVFAMDKKIKNVQVNIQTGSALKPIGASQKSIQFNEPDEQMVNFEYEVLPTSDIQKITVEVSGNGEKASYEVEMDVENPNPYSHQITEYQLEPRVEQKIDYSAYGEPDTRKVKVELSTLPPMNFTRRLQYLIHYPHGCTEQTTSAGFPQLFLDDIFDLQTKDKQETEKNIKKVIERIGNAQLTNGALPFWPGTNQPNAWATSYAGHFMLEAKEKGYSLPISFLNNWITYQNNEAKKWSIYDYAYNTSLDQAYRLYTLALAGQPELSAMNRLRESGKMNNEAKWRLAAAYALAGKKEVAQKIAASANLSFTADEHAYFNFGSSFRNKAMALETMVALEDNQQKELAESIAKDLNSDRWMSTQETSYGLLALSKMVKKNGGKSIEIDFTQNGKKETIQSDKALVVRDLISEGETNSLHILNKRDNKIYVNLYQEGKLPLGKETEQGSNLKITTQFVDGEGKNIGISKVRQGTEITAQITVTNTSRNFINDVALTQAFPSGWEIINTSFTDLKGGASGLADYIDIRDDRVHFYFDLAAGKAKTFTVKLNASYLGKYYLPGTYAEGMYDHAYYYQTKGQWVEIEP